MHKRLTVVARYFNRARRQTVKRRATRRESDATFGKLDGKAADPGNSTGEFKLRVALGQSPLPLLPNCDVAGDAEQSNRVALGIAHNGAFDRDPARLAAMRVIWRMYHTVFRVPDTARARRLRKGIIYMLEVASVDVASRLSDRSRRYIMSVSPGCARIALEVPGGKVRVECTQFRSIKRQLKALIAPIKQRFIAAPLGEQRGENEGQHRTRQDDGLRGKDAVGKSDARVSEMSNAEG